MKNFWKNLSEKGPIVALAPMDGYCDSAYRYVNKLVAPDIVVFSEFYSADGLMHNPRLPERVLPFYDEEHPLIFQIFGNDEKSFLEAGKIIQDYGADGIDINMGCPAKKVVKCGYGSGLMLDRDQAMKIVNTLAENLDIPISVKTRLGWENPEDLPEFGKSLEDAGCSLLSVHARTFKQAFKGDADWTGIFPLKEKVSIPVLGNGDVKDYNDGVKKMESEFWNTQGESLDGFMIGRSSMGNPWCFLPGNVQPSLDEILKIMKIHAEKLTERKGEQRACMEIRKHLANYLHGFEGVKAFRQRLTTVESLEDVSTILEEIRATN